MPFARGLVPMRLLIAGAADADADDRVPPPAPNRDVKQPPETAKAPVRPLSMEDAPTPGQTPGAVR